MRTPSRIYNVQLATHFAESLLVQAHTHRRKDLYIHTYCTYSYVELSPCTYTHRCTCCIHHPQPGPPSPTVHTRSSVLSPRGNCPTGNPASPDQTAGTVGVGGWNGLQLPVNLLAELFVCAEQLFYRACGPFLSPGRTCCLLQSLFLTREFHTCGKCWQICQAS